MVVLGVIMIFGGLLSLGAGVADRRARRRIRKSGVAVWATAVSAPTSREDSPSAYRPLLRFTTEDGRAVEAFSPVAPTASRPLADGQRVLVHYDPADPAQVVVHGTGPYSEVFFILLGAVAIAAAIVAMILA